MHWQNGNNMSKKETDERETWKTRAMDTTELREIRVEQPTTQLNVHSLIKRIYELMDERENLRNKLKKIECETVERLRREGQLCGLNCVSLAMLWICKHKLESIKFICCAAQFEKIVTKIAFHDKELSKEYLKCGYFMEILIYLELVKNVYEKLDANEAWEKLMNMKERVCILVKWNAPNVGHAVVFDLETRTSTTIGEEVKLYDGQALLGEQEVTINLKKMIEYVNRSVGLTLYTVDLDKLDKIMNDTL